MGKLGKAVGVGALFAGATVGAFTADILVGDARQDRLEDCAKLEDEEAANRCVENVRDHYNVDGAINAIEFLGVLGLIFTGVRIYEIGTQEDDPQPQPVPTPEPVQ